MNEDLTKDDKCAASYVIYLPIDVYGYVVFLFFALFTLLFIHNDKYKKLLNKNRIYHN